MKQLEKRIADLEAALHTALPLANAMIGLLRVTRVEVIDDTGRAYVCDGAKVALDYQDEGRTLKVLVAKQGKQP